jgi:Ni/Fe-hydrogenase subunit HybB-like protein
VLTLGALYTMLVVFVHLLFMSDFGLSLVPGWHSAVMPAYHAVSGFEIAIGMVVVLLGAARHLDARMARSCAKLMLSLGLLWFYFTWCELLTQWYGRTPDEQSLLALFMFGPGSALFAVAVVCEFLAPTLVLIWNPARSSPTVLTGVATVVVLGGFVDRLRLFVGAWTVATPTPAEHLPDALPALALPGLAALAACIGSMACAALVLVVALRRISPMSDWEQRAVQRLTPERAVLRTRTVVVARPS